MPGGSSSFAAHDFSRAAEPHQQTLRFPGQPHPWIERAIGWLIRRANSAGSRHRFRWDWWPTKDAALKNWGRRDGWDLQVFGCWGHRAPTPEGCGCSADCERCDGTGIHRAVELERWQVGPYILHRPKRVLEVAPVPPGGLPEELPRVQIAGRQEAWIARPEEAAAVRRYLSGNLKTPDDWIDPDTLRPGKVFIGRVEHRRRRGADLAFWLLLALLGRKPWAGAGTALLSRARRRAVGAWRTVQATISAAWYLGRGYRVVRQAAAFYVVDQFGDRMPCPECAESGAAGPEAHRLVAEIDHVHRDGTWEPGGLSLWCANDSDCWSAEDLPAGAFCHRMWQSDWIPTSTIVDRWARDHIRVFNSPLAETSDAPRIDDIPF